MSAGNMPGLARLIEFHRQKSHIVRQLIEGQETAVSSRPGRPVNDNDNGGEQDCPVLHEAIGHLRPDQMRREHIPQAIAEMEEILRATERSADEIMSKAEELMEKEEAMDGAIAILEACAFQDLVGQRASKVRKLLESLEERFHSLVHETGVPDRFDDIDEDELAEERRRKELILHGPQMSGEGVSQDEIDALLAS